jgi:hypothetical protein
LWIPLRDLRGKPFIHAGPKKTYRRLPCVFLRPLSTVKGLFPQVFYGFFRYLPHFYGFLSFILEACPQNPCLMRLRACFKKDVA